MTNLTVTTMMLVAVLEHIPGAAIVTDAGGRMLVANQAGRRRLTLDPTFAARLARALGGKDPELQVNVLADTAETQYLVIARCDDHTEQLITTAGSRWQLTPRQRDVLGCVARGYSNARVSAELGISERTVEVHMTVLLERARCVSRSELIASVLLGA